jgi:hypothetical protein
VELSTFGTHPSNELDDVLGRELLPNQFEAAAIRAVRPGLT